MGELVPHPDLGPPLHPGLSSEQRIEAWIDLMETGDELFQAGLKLRGEEGRDLLDAEQESYSRYVEEHDRRLMKIARRFGDDDGR